MLLLHLELVVEARASTAVIFSKRPSFYTEINALSRPINKFFLDLRSPSSTIEKDKDFLLSVQRIVQSMDSTSSIRFPIKRRL